MVRKCVAVAACALLLTGCAARVLMIPEARPLLKDVASALHRGPVLQNVKPHEITVMGRPVDAYLAEEIVVTVVPEGGTMVLASGLFDKSKDTFEITVGGLPAGRTCTYTVTLGDKTVGPFDFVTAPKDARQPVRIALYGDTRSRSDKHALVADAILREKPCIVLCAGDLVANGRRKEQWNSQYFLPARALLAHVPMFPCLGNHERRGKYYFDLLSLPGNESYYSFDYGPVHFVIVDQYQPYGPESEQYRWLEEDLAKAGRPWTIVMFHVPPFGASKSRGVNQHVIKTLVPVLEKHKVDLVLNGHDHHYVRTKPLAKVGGGFGVTYLVSGGGGAPIYALEERPWTASVYAGLHYIICEADRKRLSFTARTPEGKVIDTFVLDQKTPPVAESYPDLIATPADASK